MTIPRHIEPTPDERLEGAGLTVWMNGSKIGVLARARPESISDLTFRYDDDATRSFSVAFPGRNVDGTPAVYRGERVFRWFNNLLPQNSARKRFANRVFADYNDVYGILAGNDTAEYIGAVHFCDTGLEQTYREVDALDLKRLMLPADRWADRPSDGKDRAISLSGVMSKTGIAVDGDGRWTVPERPGGLSTHVLKVNHANLSARAIEVVEACSQLALSKVGVEAAETSVVMVGDTPAVLSRRFDRATVKDRDGWHTRALHQEDLMMASGGDTDVLRMQPGVPGAWADEHGYKALAGILREHGKEPEKGLLALSRLAAATFLLGDSDKHPKNIALLHEDDPENATGAKVRLAPAYDTVSVYCLAEEGYSQDQALPIGPAYRRDEIGPAAIGGFARDIGLHGEQVNCVFRDVAERLPDAFSDSAAKVMAEQPVMNREVAGKSLDETTAGIQQACLKLLGQYR